MANVPLYGEDTDAEFEENQSQKENQTQTIGSKGVASGGGDVETVGENKVEENSEKSPGDKSDADQENQLLSSPPLTPIAGVKRVNEDRQDDNSTKSTIVSAPSPPTSNGASDFEKLMLEGGDEDGVVLDPDKFSQCDDSSISTCSSMSVETSTTTTPSTSDTTPPIDDSTTGSDMDTSPVKHDSPADSNSKSSTEAPAVQATPVTQSVPQPVSQPVSQPASQPVSQPSSQPPSQPVVQPARASVIQPLPQPVLAPPVLQPPADPPVVNPGLVQPGVIQPIEQLANDDDGDWEMVPMPPPIGFPAEFIPDPEPPRLRWPASNGSTSRSRRIDFNNSIDLRSVPVIRRSKHERVDPDRYQYREENEM